MIGLDGFNPLNFIVNGIDTRLIYETNRKAVIYLFICPIEGPKSFYLWQRDMYVSELCLPEDRQLQSIVVF